MDLLDLVLGVAVAANPSEIDAEFRRFLEVSDRPRPIALTQPGHPAIVVHQSMVGIAFDRPIKILHRPLQLTQLIAGQTAIVVGIRVIGCKLDRHIKILDRRLEIIHAPIGQPPVLVGKRIVGIELDRLGGILDRPLLIIQVGARQTPVEIGRRQGRVARLRLLNRPIIVGDRRRIVAHIRPHIPPVQVSGSEIGTPFEGAIIVTEGPVPIAQIVAGIGPFKIGGGIVRLEFHRSVEVIDRRLKVPLIDVGRCPLVEGASIVGTQGQGAIVVGDRLAGIARTQGRAPAIAQVAGPHRHRQPIEQRRRRHRTHHRAHHPTRRTEPLPHPLPTLGQPISIGSLARAIGTCATQGRRIRQTDATGSAIQASQIAQGRLGRLIALLKVGTNHPIHIVPQCRGDFGAIAPIHGHRLVAIALVGAGQLFRGASR